jgi:predicted phage-related endonuclease
MDPWRSAYDVWLEKTGQVRGEQTKPWMETGQFFEMSVLRWAVQQYGPIVRNQRRTYPAAYLASNCDAIVKADGVPVEAKTAGLYGPLVEKWGEAESDEVPDRIIIQCHAQMICTDRGNCHVAAFLGGRGFVRFEITRDPAVAAMVVEAATRFWELNVLQNIAPDNSLPSEGLLKRMRREPNKTVPVPDSLALAYVEAKAAAKSAEAQVKEFWCRIVTAMGDAEAAVSNVTDFTYYESTRRDLDEKRLKEERPEIVLEFTRPITYRTLRVKKRKENGNGNE